MDTTNVSQIHDDYKREHLNEKDMEKIQKEAENIHSDMMFFKEFIERTKRADVPSYELYLQLPGHINHSIFKHIPYNARHYYCSGGVVKYIQKFLEIYYILTDIYEQHFSVGRKFKKADIRHMLTYAKYVAETLDLSMDIIVNGFVHGDEDDIAKVKQELEKMEAQ